MQAMRKSNARRAITIAVAMGLASAASSALAAPNADDAQAHEAWKQAIARVPAPAEGCFHAVYPGTRWVQEPCVEAPHRYLPVPRKPGTGAGHTQTVGNGADWALKVPLTLSKIVGSFPKVTGVTSEKSVSVPGFGSGGILGSNEYMLEIASGLDFTTAACKSHSGCTIFQSFIYSTDYVAKGSAGLFMQYFLVGWGSSACPAGWDSDGSGDCVTNSKLVSVPDEPITQLQQEKLSATVVKGGNDTLVFTDGNTAHSVSAKDSVLDLATAWNEAEFNIFGDNSGERAVFNTGSSVSVEIAEVDGSSAAPTCEPNGGTSGDSNNLTLGPCIATGGATPNIQFTESY